MTQRSLEELSRREREIMEIVYQQGEVTAAKLQPQLSGNPSNSSVRTFLRILEEKGMIVHHRQGPRYIYKPKFHAETARRSAVRHLLKSLFAGSAEKMVATLLDASGEDLTAADYDRLSRLIETARQDGR